MTDRQKQIKTKTKELLELLKTEAIECEKNAEQLDTDVAALVCVSFFDHKEKAHDGYASATGIESSFDYMVSKIDNSLKTKLTSLLVDPFEALFARMKTRN